MDAEVERCAQVEGAPDEQSGFGGLGGVEFVQRAVVAAVAVGGVRAQAGIA